MDVVSNLFAKMQSHQAQHYMSSHIVLQYYFVWNTTKKSCLSSQIASQVFHSWIPILYSRVLCSLSSSSENFCLMYPYMFMPGIVHLQDKNQWKPISCFLITISVSNLTLVFAFPRCSLDISLHFFPLISVSLSIILCTKYYLVIHLVALNWPTVYVYF